MRQERQRRLDCFRTTWGRGRFAARALVCCALTAAPGLALAETQTWNSAKSFSETTTIDDDVTLVGDVEVTLSGDATVTLNGAVSGDGSIRKKGGGALVFAHEGNTFKSSSGQSIVVEYGAVQANASEALGAGSVECAGGWVRLNAPGATFSNDMTFSVYNKDFYQLCFDESATIAGDVTVSSEIVKFNVGTSTTRAGKKATFTGRVLAENSDVWLYTVEDYDFSGAVSCRTLYLNGSGYWSGRQGTTTLRSAENVIGLVSTAGANLVLQAANAMGGARYLVRQYFSGGGCQNVAFNGFDQAVKALDATAGTAIDGTGGKFMAASGNPVLTVTGDETPAVTRSYVSDARMKLKIDVDVSKYPAFVQTFSGSLNTGDNSYANRKNLTAQPLEVASGTLRLDNDVKFEAVPSISIGEKGVLQVGAVTNALKGVTAIDCRGRIEIEAAACAPFADGQVALALAGGAKLAIPAGMTLSLKSLTVDGVAKTKGFYDASTLPVEGGGEVYTDGEAASVADVAWTAGGGDDTSVGTAANWGGTLPGLLGFETRATFAQAGAEATVDRAVRLAKLTFDAPGDFALRGSGNARLSIGADGLAVAAGPDGGEARAYAVEPPVSVYDAQTWTIPTNRTLTLGGGLQNAGGAFVTVRGKGGLVWRGTNTLAASMIFEYASLTVENGTIASVNHAWEGEVWGSSPLGTLMEMKTNVIVLANGRIEKTMRFEPRYSGGSLVTARAGTTNEVAGYMRQNDATVSTGFTVEDGAELTLSGGYHTWRQTDLYGEGALRVRSRPFASKGAFGFLVRDGLVVFEDGGTLVTVGKWLALGYAEGSTASVEFRSSGAFGTGDGANYPISDSRLALGTRITWDSRDAVLCDRADGVGTATFHSTTQEVLQVVCGATGVLTGDAGSLLRVVGDQDNAKELSVTRSCEPGIRGEVGGALSIEMGGTGTLVLSGRDFASRGALSVTNGTLRLSADATWANGSGVSAGGNGTLVLEKGRGQLSRGAKVRFGGNGRIQIGGLARVASVEVWDDEAGAWTEMPRGDYGPGSAGAMAGRVVSGTLRVGDRGTTVVLR